MNLGVYFLSNTPDNNRPFTSRTEMCLGEAVFTGFNHLPPIRSVNPFGYVLVNDDYNKHAKKNQQGVKVVLRHGFANL